MYPLRTTIVLLTLAACGDSEPEDANTTPTAGIESPDSEDALFEGIAATFRGRALDSDDLPEDLLASWWIGDEAVCPDAEPTATGETFCDITLPGGLTEIRLEVTDMEGLAGTAVESFWARPSADPTAEITSFDETAQYFSDQPLAFEGIVGDVEDAADQLVVWWESSIDGPLEAIDSTVQPSGRVDGIGFLTEGDHQIRLYVEDRAGNVSFDTAFVRVHPPTDR